VGRPEVSPAQSGQTAALLPTPIGLQEEPSRDWALPEAGQTPLELRVYMYDLLQIHEDRRLGARPKGRDPPRNPQRDACAADVVVRNVKGSKPSCHGLRTFSPTRTVHVFWAITAPQLLQLARPVGA
jgi:hypothetical protein